MDSTTNTALEVRTLGDALGIGLDLSVAFGDGDFCAVWLGTADGTMRDFVVCTEDRGRDITRLIGYAAVVSAMVDADRAVLWRTDPDPTDGPRLVREFFERGSTLEDAGVVLVDEIVLDPDQLRSMAVTSFSDEEGWDDVSERLSLLPPEPGRSPDT